MVASNTSPYLSQKHFLEFTFIYFQLKDIMTVALQAEGENVSKLEKADILELTVSRVFKIKKI